MKLCWVLGVLAVACCEGNDVIKENIISSTVALHENGTTNQLQQSLSGNNRTLIKRQTGQTAGKISTFDEQNNQNNADPQWKDNLDSLWLPLEKRTKFSSWAGKRDPEDSKENKRAKFSSWAGKRTFDDIDADPFEYSKRAKFSSWAGKRGDLSDLDDKRKLLAHTLAGYNHDLSEDYDLLDDAQRNQDNEFNEEKRGRFSSWGGKRADASYENKRKFSSWSGKRSFNQSPYFDLINQLYAPTKQDLETNVANTNRLRMEEGKLAKLFDENETFTNHQLENVDPENTELSRYIGDPGYWSDSDFGLSADKRDGFSSTDEKRKFSSWGGKRSGTPFDSSFLMDGNSDIEKRTRFSSWAGKRGFLPFWKNKIQGKRGKFSSWAGKRSDSSLTDLTEEDKRTRFSSWGGKRSMTDPSDSYEDKRARFSSWAGKRFDNDNNDYFNNIKRDTNWGGLKKKIKGRGFSSWGGKRNFLEDSQFNDDSETMDAIKRANKFSSWAGKRGQDIDEEKRKFSSWGGKRDYFQFVEQPKRAKFSSWAGKRSVNPNDGPDVDKRKEGRKSGLLRRYNRFNSWRGKKDNVIPNNDTEQTKLEDVNFNQTDDFFSSNKSKRGFTNYYRQFEMIKRNPLLRAWIGRSYPDAGLVTWKRRPAFSSWGGKRSLTQETVGEMPQTYDDVDVDEEKRERFSSWGGKRHDIEKRSPKTSTQQILQKLAPNKKNSRTSKMLDSRTALETHFYLRSSKNGLLTPAFRPIRRQFYAWGGKRAPQS